MRKYINLIKYLIYILYGSRDSLIYISTVVEIVFISTTVEIVCNKCRFLKLLFNYYYICLLLLHLILLYKNKIYIIFKN